MESTDEPLSKKQSIRARNEKRPRSNLARISKYLHIAIFEYISARDIFRVCLVSRALHKSTQEPGVWERYFPDQIRLRGLLEAKKS